MLEAPADNSGTAAKNTSSFKCAARVHLSKHGCAFGIYDLACALTATSGEPFYASAVSVAEHLGTSVASARRGIKFLADNGWFQQLDGLSRFGTNLYRAVLHDDWALTHPGDCKAMRSASEPRPQPVSSGTPKQKRESKSTKQNNPGDALQRITARLTRLSGDTVAFGDKARLRLASLVEQFTEAEFVGAFKRWTETQDFTNARILQYADMNFAERARDLLDSEREQRRQAERDREMRDRAARQLAEEAQRQREEAAASEADDDFDPIAAL